MASLSIRNVQKRYGALDILKGVDIDVGDGEFLVLVGPSGCGKSTLLNMIAGLDDISAGEIAIDGRRVNELHPKDRDIAMVFQSYALYPNMSVRQNIAFGMEMRGVPKPERERAIGQVAKLLQIEPMLDRKPSQLSGGQRQRVAMGRALVRNPKVFLFDEPLSNLDAKLRVEMRTEIKKLHQRLGATIVYVTHDQIEAMTLATRIAVMRGGELQQLGTPHEIYTRPNNVFVAGFMGSPAMNLIPALVSGGDGGPMVRFSTLDGGAGLALGADLARRVRPGQEVLLGLRPECFSDLGDEHSRGLPTFACTVELTEPTGADLLAMLTLGGVETVARLRPDAAVHPGASAVFAVDMTKAVLFDPASGVRI